MRAASWWGTLPTAVGHSSRQARSGPPETQSPSRETSCSPAPSQPPRPAPKQMAASWMSRTKAGQGGMPGGHTCRHDDIFYAALLQRWHTDSCRETAGLEMGLNLHMRSTGCIGTLQTKAAWLPDS